MMIIIIVQLYDWSKIDVKFTHLKIKNDPRGYCLPSLNTSTEESHRQKWKIPLKLKFKIAFYFSIQMFFLQHF